jgi:hypothetical protein
MKGGNYKVRFPNEIHATDFPFKWEEFEATNILDEEVFGRYGTQMVAVRRRDYDKYLLENIPSIDTNKR